MKNKLPPFSLVNPYALGAIMVLDWWKANLQWLQHATDRAIGPPPRKRPHKS